MEPVGGHERHWEVDSAMGRKAQGFGHAEEVQVLVVFVWGQFRERCSGLGVVVEGSEQQKKFFLLLLDLMV